jgi:hypothetical protein
MTNAPKAWTAPEITVLRAARDARVMKDPSFAEGQSGPSTFTAPSGLQ